MRSCPSVNRHTLGFTPRTRKSMLLLNGFHERGYFRGGKVTRGINAFVHPNRISRGNVKLACRIPGLDTLSLPVIPTGERPLNNGPSIAPQSYYPGKEETPPLWRGLLTSPRLRPKVSPATLKRRLSPVSRLGGVSYFIAGEEDVGLACLFPPFRWGFCSCDWKHSVEQ